MNYSINENICQKKGMTIPELLVVLLVKSDVCIAELLNDMRKKEIIIPDMFNDGKFLVTQRWANVARDILLSGDKDLPDTEKLELLATAMAKLFPSGAKPGTNSMWKGNRKDVVQKLQIFYKTYGNYSDEQILQATKQYVDKFANNRQTMRILKYFILKDNESDLASILENMGETKNKLSSFDELRV